MRGLAAAVLPERFTQHEVHFRKVWLQLDGAIPIIGGRFILMARPVDHAEIVKRARGVWRKCCCRFESSNCFVVTVQVKEGQPQTIANLVIVETELDSTLQ